MISLDLNGTEKGKGLPLALYNKTQVVLGKGPACLHAENQELDGEVRSQKSGPIYLLSSGGAEPALAGVQPRLIKSFTQLLVPILTTPAAASTNCHV